MTATPAIVWFQQDLRLEDHPALEAAVARGGPVVPVYIFAPEEEVEEKGGGWAPGGATRWWLHQSLARLGESLAARGSRLILRQGDSLEELRKIVSEIGAGAVFVTRRVEPAAAGRNARVLDALKRDGVPNGETNGSLLWDPESLRTSSGQPFRVFTPFYRACLALEQPSRPRSAPARLVSPANWPDSLPLAALDLEPSIDWAAGMRDTWCPGEVGAQAKLDRFRCHAVQCYPEQRDLPGTDGTSQLSPHLHFGEISPRQVWHAIAPDWANPSVQPRRAAAPIANGNRSPSAAAEAFLRQLVWREFAHHLLHHFPDTARQPLRREFAEFPSEDDPKALRAWQRGCTGYPLVDAGMRQLWTTGWMHNRVRMVVASFLVKHLLTAWQRGAEWFWDTLVDADLANNTLGWQWVAGCGADAAPYFRIFNPVTQSQRFDPAGNYIRRWIPELAGLSDSQIHAPWQVASAELQAAGVVLGRNYPRPIVEHAAARQRALAALAAMNDSRRKTSSPPRGKLTL